MAALSSNNIRVYPSSKRVGIDPGAKFTTEYNLTNLVNRLTNKKAFVITDSVPSTLSDNILTNFEFNILGYYFLVNLPLQDLTPMRDNDVYLNATISLVQLPYGDNADFKVWWQLDGLDLGGDSSTKQFSGLQLSWDSMTSHFLKDNQTLKNLSGVWEELDPVSGNTLYTFTILLRTNSGYMVPPESKIRIFTSTDGTYRGVSIDDGELTSNDINSSILPINIPATSVNLNLTELTLKVGDLFTLEPIFTPLNTTDSCIFTSSDPEIVLIQDNGVLKAISVGACIITAKCNTDAQASCHITVTDAITLQI